MTLAKATVIKSMFASAKMVANSDHFTETRAPRANRARAGDASRLLASHRGLEKSFFCQAKMSVQCRVQRRTKLKRDRVVCVDQFPNLQKHAVD